MISILKKNQSSSDQKEADQLKLVDPRLRGDDKSAFSTTPKSRVAQPKATDATEAQTTVNRLDRLQNGQSSRPQNSPNFYILKELVALSSQSSSLDQIAENLDPLQVPDFSEIYRKTPSGKFPFETFIKNRRKQVKEYGALLRSWKNRLPYFSAEQSKAAIVRIKEVKEKMTFAQRELKESIAMQKQEKKIEKDLELEKKYYKDLAARGLLGED